MSIFPKTNIFMGIQQFASSFTLSIRGFIKPKSIRDYYTIGKFMISKNLARLILLVVTIIAAIYLMIVLPERIRTTVDNRNINKIYTKYNSSRSLKKYEGTIRVISKKNDAEYVGGVANGCANGQGILRDTHGNLVYDGEFVNNQYEGEGILYYPGTGKTKYVGKFQSNKFNEEGKNYDEEGNIIYAGDYVSGYKDGNGTLYGELGIPIFSGIFTLDRPNIETAIGKNISQINNQFLEEGVTYTYKDSISKIYEELGVMIIAEHHGRQSLDSGAIIDQIYILSNRYFQNIPKDDRNTLDKEISKLGGVKKYAGYTKVLFPEMSAIDHIRKSGRNELSELSTYQFNKEYLNILESQDYRSEDKLYVQSYEYNNLLYTFYFNNRDDKSYIFYSVGRLR